MSFSNSIAQWLAADGIPAVYSSNINLNNNVPVVMPSATGTFSPVTPRAGYVRIKSNILNKNVNVKVAAIVATFTDGNTANIYNGDTNSGSNGLVYDSTFFFWYDRAVANINITNIATTNNTATFDVEVAGMQ
jgi:hypothetical protein